MGEGFFEGSKTNGHRWRFFRYGGFDQVHLEKGADLLNLDKLDQKLWAALSCPTQGLEFDGRTLQLIDLDGDGHIHVPEVLAAVKWALSLLKNPDDLLKGDSSLPLEAINDSTEQGRGILKSAREILANLGKPGGAAITVEDMADEAAIFAQTRFNGDGVVPPRAAEDAQLQRLIGEIIDCLGAEADRSGEPGINTEKVNVFFAEAEAYSVWCGEAENEDGVSPEGKISPEAFLAFKAIKGKVDDYFTRCRLAKYDPRATKALNREETEYSAIAGRDLTLDAPEVAGFPLAQTGDNRPLPLEEGLNPAWKGAMDDFVKTLVRPLPGGKQNLTEEEWLKIRERFFAHDAWMARKAGSKVEKLGLPRIREILAGSSRTDLVSLIEQDLALAAEFDHLASVERLTRYYRDLRRLLDNFVSFREFYVKGCGSVFQAGTLYLDGRSCDLCIRVQDAAKHAELASLGNTYLAYCDCVRNGGAEKMTVAAAFTGGDADFLMVGRNGVFYDRQGKDWDATIVRLVEHPISIRQAFWSPYKRLGRMVNEQIAKLAAARETAQQQAQAAAVGAGVPAALPTTFDIAKFAGIFAAIGLAVGAIGTAIAAIVTGFLQLAWWQMPLALAALVLAISVPSVIIAWLKLRQRMIGPLLDANGWAINGRLRINVPFGSSLTKVAALPEGASRSMEDPFAEKKSPWPKIILLVLLLGLLGYLLFTAGLFSRLLGLGGI